MVPPNIPIGATDQFYTLTDRCDAVEQDHDRDRELEREEMREQRHGNERGAEAANTEDDVSGEDDQGGEYEDFGVEGHVREKRCDREVLHIVVVNPSAVIGVILRCGQSARYRERGTPCNRDAYY